VEMEKAVQGLTLSTKVPRSPFRLPNLSTRGVEALHSLPSTQRRKEDSARPTVDSILVSHTASRFLPPLRHVAGQPDLCPDYGSLFSGVETLALSG
jgi:hypothetical protein